MAVTGESERLHNRPLYITFVGYADELFCLNNFPLLFVIRIQGKGKTALKKENRTTYLNLHTTDQKFCVHRCPLMCALMGNGQQGFSAGEDCGTTRDTSHFFVLM